MKRARKKFLLFILIGFGSIAAIRFWVQAGTPRAQALLGTPVRWFSQAGSAVSAWTAQRSDLEALRKENARLEALLRAAAIEQSNTADLLTSYESLASLLRYQERAAKPLVAARIIGNSPDPFRNAIYIDRGTFDGIQVKAAVVAYDGIYVGTVTDAWERVALVQLVSDQKSKTPAKVLNRDGAVGILEGSGALYTLSLIPRNIDIAPGDIVVTEQFGTAIAGGLPIGTIISIDAGDESPFKTAFITPLVDTKSLRIIGVMPVPDLPL
ncbi:MAG: rod shape-determining protein MreC [bacterium]|nr:rod shape-determining protein MreC [bacterium]